VDRIEPLIKAQRGQNVIFKVAFDAIRQLMATPSEPKRRGKIGFGRENES